MTGTTAAALALLRASKNGIFPRQAIVPPATDSQDASMPPARIDVSLREDQSPYERQHAQRRKGLAVGRSEGPTDQLGQHGPCSEGDRCRERPVDPAGYHFDFSLPACLAGNLRWDVSRIPPRVIARLTCP